MSEREKFYIEASYQLFATGNLEKARQVCELWVQTYPRDSMPIAYLGIVLRDLGQYERALPQLREGVRRDPESPIRHGHLASTYVLLNRFKEAHATAEEAQAKKLDSPDLHVWLYVLAFLENNSAAMAREVAWSTSKPGYEDYLLSLEAGTSAYFGKVKKARELTDRAMALAERAQRRETAANYESWQALTEALFGNRLVARERIAVALKLSSARGVEITGAAIAALLGDTDRAQTLAGDIAKQAPDDTLLQNNVLPIVNAQLALNRNDARTAIDALQRAMPYELALGDKLASAFGRGTAYLAAHRAEEAAAEFQRILVHPGVVGSLPWGALARLGLARAYGLQGDTAKAKAAYQDFLTLWKDADPDIPILIAAKSEYAKLK